jgi:hypothetical protein
LRCKAFDKLLTRIIHEMTSTAQAFLFAAKEWYLQEVD